MDIISTTDKKHIIIATVYFFLSTVITWYFIQQSRLYSSTGQQILSCSIAGAKWAIQLIAAGIFLRKNKWQFIRKTGFTCLVGSLLLLPYCFLPYKESVTFFSVSLIVAVLAMIISYYRNVTQLQTGIKW